MKRGSITIRDQQSKSDELYQKILGVSWNVHCPCGSDSCIDFISAGIDRTRSRSDH